MIKLKNIINESSFAEPSRKRLKEIDIEFKKLRRQYDRNDPVGLNQSPTINKINDLENKKEVILSLLKTN